MRFIFFLLSLLLISFGCKNAPDNNTRSLDVKSPNKKVEVEGESQKNNDFPTIMQNGFMNFKIGDLIVDDGYKVRESTLETGEGIFIVYELFDNRYGKLGYLMPNSEKEKKVRSITILNNYVKTKEGIHVGSSFSELLKQFPNIKVFGSEVEGRTHAVEGNLSYRLAFNSSSKSKIDRNQIPPNTKITEIIIQ